MRHLKFYTAAKLSLEPYPSGEQKKKMCSFKRNSKLLHVQFVARIRLLPCSKTITVQKYSSFQLIYSEFESKHIRNAPMNSILIYSDPYLNNEDKFLLVLR